MHKTGNIAEGLPFNSLKVELVDPERVAFKEAGYYLQQHLYNRIGQNSGPHILRLEVRPGRRPYGLNSNDVATRYDKTLRVEYELIDSVSGQKLYGDRVSSTTTFGSSIDPYARISAEQNATEQTARDAADRILTRLAIYYKDPEAFDKARAERIKRRQEKRAEKNKIENADDEIVELP